MKIIQLIISAITASSLIVIAIQLSQISKVPEPVINIAAPQIPAPVIKEVVVNVDVPTPKIQTVEVIVPAPVIETVEVNVPKPIFSGDLDVDFPRRISVDIIGGLGSVEVRPASFSGFKITN